MNNRREDRAGRAGIGRRDFLKQAALGAGLAATGIAARATCGEAAAGDRNDAAVSESDVAVVKPWRRVPLDPEYGGAWVIAGDVDGDGAVEIVSAQNVNRNDVHYTSAAVAQRLDGSVLWRWGAPEIGHKRLGYDVACQIYDWDGDGRNEVVLCTEGFLVELDGATGKEKRRLLLPTKDATDCLVFANLSGKSCATDVLVKTRYTQIWALDRDGRQLWTVKNPGGYRTAHQPVPVDLDGDGRDEIMAGYAMLNSDGTVRWVFKSEKVNLAKGHLDCVRVLRPGKTPADFRLVLTCCGANNIAVIDGDGRSLWEVSGHHFESVDVGKVCRDVPGLQLIVDIGHRPWGEGPLWVLDENGRKLCQILTNSSRHHALIDWSGDGTEAILIGGERGLYDGHGKRIATFEMGDPDVPGEAVAMVGDMTGDGVPDVILTTQTCSAMYIYKNEKGKKPAKPPPLGTGVNFTLY